MNINTKSLSTMVSQLEIFDDVVNLHYENKELSLNGNGDNGKIRIILLDEKHNNINKSDTNIEHDIRLCYSIRYINYFCSFSKVNPNVNISFKQDMPMVMHYELEDSENSYVKFYLAPKIDD